MSHPNTDQLFDHLQVADADVAAHAASCMACRAELVELEALVQGARAIEPDPAADDEALIALALDEVPAAPPRARWPYGLALAAAALIAVAGWFAQVQPTRLTLAAVDATTGALVAEIAPGAVVSFQVPVRIVLGDGITVDLDAASTFAVLDMTAPDVWIQLDAGTLHWTLTGPPSHTLTVATTGDSVVVHDGTGDVSASLPPAAEVKSPKPTRRRPTASDLRTPTPDVPSAPEPSVVSPPVEAASPIPYEPPAPTATLAPTPAPAGPEAMYKAAELAMANSDTANALVLLDELAARWPEHPSGRLALFDRARLIERTDPSHAAAAWRRYVQLGPDEPLYDTAKTRLCRVDPPSCRN